MFSEHGAQVASRCDPRRRSGRHSRVGGASTPSDSGVFRGLRAGGSRIARRRPDDVRPAGGGGRPHRSCSRGSTATSRGRARERLPLRPGRGGGERAVRRQHRRSSSAATSSSTSTPAKWVSPAQRASSEASRVPRSDFGERFCARSSRRLHARWKLSTRLSKRSPAASGGWSPPLHAPTGDTVIGEPPGIWAFLGSRRLAGPIGAHRPDAVFHGHAHHGTARALIGEVPVWNGKRVT